MTRDQWAKIDRVHQAALERTGPERAAYLEVACAGDADLRREVESLLAYATVAEGFLERPALQEAAGVFEADIVARAGVLPVVPGYTVLELLGTGGMGVVYLAEEDPPLRRRVALKLVRPGLDSLSVLARFEAERQALGLMDHPNIAAVFGTGVSADGRPFVAMEFVAGIPITEYCDRARLSIQARLGMFTSVCAAVQHAHQKGVIHRDLKPSNVLLTDHDGQPVPKVIDFGTAAWADRPRAVRLGLTDVGTIVGTLEYMSPEQAAASPDIDTTTDVYSLGVLLYELLVGDVPFDRQRLREIGYDEMRRVILESDPPRPSTQLARRVSSISSTATARGTDVGRLTRQLTGDLDWIVLRALEKDRRRRYPTVAAFATDIERFLNDQPVDARPPSAAYRVGKFARRHRGVVSATAALLIVLVAGFLTSTALYFRAERARADVDRERSAAMSQRALAESARSFAEAAAVDATVQRNAAITANATADRERLRATEQANRATAALSESEFRNYAITIAAADGELRLNLASSARNRLLAVPADLRGWEWHHLFLKTDTSLATLDSMAPCARPGEGTLFPLTISDKVVTLSDGGARIYLKRCTTLESWAGPNHAHATHQAPGKILAVASTGEALTVGWMASGTNVRSALRLIDPMTSRVLSQVGPLEAEPVCADVTRDGTRLAVGFMPQFNQSAGEPMEDFFDVWDVRTGRRLLRLAPPKPPAFDTRSRTAMSCMVAFNPDATQLATSGATVHVWRLDSGVEVAADVTQSGTVSQPIAWTHDGVRLAIGRLTGLVDILDLTVEPRFDHLDGNGFIRVSPIPDGEDRRIPIGARKTAEVLSIAFSPDDARVVTGTGVSVGVWDVAQRALTRVLAGHSAPVVGVVVDANGRIVSADTSGQVKVWPASLSGAMTVLVAGRSLAEFAVSANGAAVGVGPVDGGLFAWGLADFHRTVVRAGSGHFDRSRPLPAGVPSTAASAWALAMSPDGRYLLAAENDTVGTVRSWAVDSASSTAAAFNANPVPDCKIVFGSDTGAVRPMAVSPDGRALAFKQGRCLVVRDLSTLAVLATMHKFDGADFGFRPDGLLMMIMYEWVLPGSTTTPSRLLIWDWRKNQVRAEVPTPLVTSEAEKRSWRVGVNASGQYIALVGGNPAIVSIWDADLRRELGRLPVPPDTQRVALSADGKRLASTTATDMTVRIWDVERRQLLLILTDDDQHRGIAFTPDGRLIVERAGGGLTIWESRKK